MAIGDKALTPRFPRKAEHAFLVTPQAAFGAPTYTGAQALHYTSFDPTRQQDAQASPEYGGDTVGANIDPSDPDFGDVTVNAPLQTNLCLNEIGFLLAYLLGAPTTKVLVAGKKHQHIFTSGAATLPLATMVCEDSEGGKVIDSVVLASLALSLAQGGGKQICDFTTVARDMIRAATGTIDSASAAAPPARLFVPKSGWTVAMDNVNIGRLLSATLNYSADINSDRYVNSGETIGDSYIGDPTASLQFALRHVNEAQRALFDDHAVPKAFTLTGAAAGGHSIVFNLPRAFVPKLFPTADDKLQQLSSTATGARSGSSAMTVTLVNSLAGY